MRVASVILLFTLAHVFAGTNDCPESHPYAYRPGYGNDYCCKSGKDRNGKLRTEPGADTSSCQWNEYTRCPVGSGCVNNDLVKENQCPETHPYAYRPRQNYDYCCQSNRDTYGTLWSDGGDDSSCMANKYSKCPVGRGCINNAHLILKGDGEACTNNEQCKMDVCFSGQCVVDPACAIEDRKGGVRQFGGQDACISNGKGVKYCGYEGVTCCQPGVELVWDDAPPVPAWHCGKKVDSEFCTDRSECRSDVCFQGVCVEDPPCVVLGWADTGIYSIDKKGGVRNWHGTDYCFSAGNGPVTCNTPGSSICCQPGGKLVETGDDWECEDPPKPEEYDLNPGGACKSGYSPLTSSWQECESAAKSLGFTGDSVRHVAYDASRRWGTSKPKGCFRAGNNRRFHFNRAAGGLEVGDDQILCKRDPEPEDRSSKMRWCPVSSDVVPHGGKQLKMLVKQREAGTMSKCQALCDDTEKCNAIVWDQAKVRCWLYADVPATKNAPKHIKGKRQTLVKLCADFQAYQGKCTYQGVERNLQQQHTDLKSRSECEAHCLEQAGCLAYEWNLALEECDIHFRPVDEGDYNLDVDCYIMEGDDFQALGEETFEAEGLAFQTEGAASGFTIVHVMAVFGFAVSAYGAFRHYIK